MTSHQLSHALMIMGRKPRLLRTVAVKQDLQGLPNFKPFQPRLLDGRHYVVTIIYHFRTRFCLTLRFGQLIFAQVIMGQQLQSGTDIYYQTISDGLVALQTVAINLSKALV